MGHMEPGVWLWELQETRPVRWADAGSRGLEGYYWEELGLGSESSRIKL